MPTGNDISEATPAEGSKDAATKRISDDDLYRHSSQYTLWSFTKEQLLEKRRTLNARVVDKVNERLQNTISSHTDLSQDELDAIKETAVPVSVDEELKFVNFFARKVQSFCQSLNLPTEVGATAISFFRRYFLMNSTMEVHPKHILLTSIFLACKSENYFIGIEAFAKKTKSQPAAILKYEFSVLESLRFTLLNHHPYRPLHGFFLDIQHILHGKVDLNYMGQIYSNCKKRITETILTDVVYHYTPPQITLACLLIEDEALTLKYLELKFGNVGVPSEPESAEAIIEEAKSEEAKSEEPKSKESKSEGSKSEGSKSEGSKSEGVKSEESKSEETKSEETLSSSKSGSTINLDLLTALVVECKDMILNVEALSKEEATKIDARLHYCQNPMLLVDRLRRQKQQRDSSAEVAAEPDSKKLKV
ncbi:unnamed protein product [Kluyveromyces dobzhanskii CBS 2104]|uniref:WGS project CCBQ000000000 data, contig 00106 n=1 Tax=Kluyveromyces dobzhanskii CBS 2104 TaxID=1427455 RepID=A0A0A8L871_9SACH|nr:unnamed protein product [Kluyveromyces dobzhanskii CBS 2104]